MSNPSNLDQQIKNKLTIGIRLSGDRADAVAALRAAQADGYKFVTTTRTDAHTVRTDLIQLDSRWWTTGVIGEIAARSEIAASLQWSQYMDLPATILPSHDFSLAAAAVLAEQLPLRVGDSQAVWLPFRLSDDFEQLLQFYNATNRHRSISVMLCFDTAMISTDNNTSKTPEQIKAEFVRNLYRAHVLIGTIPIAAVMIPLNVFIINPAGYPTLSKAHQALLSLLLRRCHNGLKILVDASAPMAEPTTANDSGPTGAKHHFKYLQHFRSTREEVVNVLDTVVAATETDYLDALQQPLQPLKDHLPSQTYEIFETDPVKYALYQQAIHQAAGTLPDPPRLMVAGAGRGKLVQACLDAVPHAAVVFAVEKNPGAVQYLRAKFAQSPKVCIVASDMRSMALDAPVDIVVSELLGSFGCNELSPECIVGLFRNNPSVVAPHTISIPAAYTSQIAPVCSTKLHQAAVQQALYPDPLRGPLAANGLVKAMETPYVVRPCAAAQMHEAMDCWSFQHATATTGQQSMEDDYHCGMERYVELTFSDFHRPAIVAEGNGYGPIDDAANKFLPVTAPHPPSSSSNSHHDDDEGLAVPWLCTGLLGSFTSQLYGSVVMSIEPHHFSKGMFSWFPLYFPLQEPILVPIGASLKVHVWRKHDAQSVWYEWCVQAYCQRGDGTVKIHATSPIHNPGGRSYRVALIA